MRYAKLLGPALIATLAACHSSSSGHPDGSNDDAGIFDLSGPDLVGVDLEKPPDAALPPLAANVVRVNVDEGPAAAMGSFNVPYISITLCAPNSTTNCQTIDHITVDTGSVGLHIISSVINPTLLSALPISTTGGNDIAECYSYASGFVFGSVRTGDLTISAEHAAAMAFIAIADPAISNTPADCGGGGMGITSVEDFGTNGIIGVGLFAPDCGSACETNGGSNPIYYGCTGGTCTATGTPLAKQLKNPVSLFPTDNNGVILQLPSIPDVGASNPTGTLTFGIGTASNNAIGSETVIPATVMPAGADSGLAVVTTTFGAESYNTSVFDSGTVAFAFQNGSVTECTGDFAGLYCPTGTQTESATITDANNAQTMVSFKLANPDTVLMLETSNDNAFDDFAITSIPPPYFIWGLPFFYGRRVFSAINGVSTPSGTGPYYAY